MRIEYTSNYRLVVDLARKCNATVVSFQYHTFVNFNTRNDAHTFSMLARGVGLNPWPINTERPGVAFEVVIERW